jgi:putative transposase
MARRLSETSCKVDIIKLSLNKAQLKQCHAVRLEAGRCYSEMLAAHVASRSDKWLSVGELKAISKKQYQLHSQSVQAVAEKIDANVLSARSNREREFKALGRIATEYPHKPKTFYTVTWKRLGLQVRDGKIHLSNGLKRQPLVLSLPYRYQNSDITLAELVWDADVYYLHVTVDTGVVPPPFIRQVKTAGIDLGEIHIASCTADTGETLIVSGRLLRSVKQLRNKKHAEYKQRMSKCKNGSTKHKRLKQSERKSSAKFTRQQRDILHKASRQIVDFCQEHSVAKLAIGDVRDISDGVNKGRKCNQKLSQWAHGQFYAYLSQKSRACGINNDYLNEAYSSKTCSVCGHVKKSSVKGRTYKCSACKAVIHRDGNGSANICSKGRYGEYSKVQVTTIKYLQPVYVPQSSVRHPQKCSSPSEAGQVAVQACA